MYEVNVGFSSEKLSGACVSNHPYAWVISAGDWDTLVSYGKNIVHRNRRTQETYLDTRFFDISFTTMVHREVFLGNKEPFRRRLDEGRAIVQDEETLRKIESGEYMLADLNCIA